MGVSALDASAGRAPNLTVVGATVNITSNCYGPAPALIAAVTIRNSGQALAANMGKVFLKKQSSGAGLEGAANLPAFGAGQEQTVNVPATSLQPFSQFAAGNLRRLAGHQMRVILRPEMIMDPRVVPNGRRPSFITPASPFTFQAVFPSGHCQN